MELVQWPIRSLPTATTLPILSARRHVETQRSVLYISTCYPFLTASLITPFGIQAVAFFVSTSNAKVLQTMIPSSLEMLVFFLLISTVILDFVPAWVEVVAQISVRDEEAEESGWAHGFLQRGEELWVEKDEDETFVYRGVVLVSLDVESVFSYLRIWWREGKWENRCEDAS